MANDGILRRLSNLWTGFLSIWVSGLEQDHPEIAYENAINSMIAKYSQLKKATAAIIRRREDVTARLKATQDELANIDRDLQAALATDQKDLGTVLIQKKQALVNEQADLQGELTQAQADADSAKSSLGQVQTEIGKLKAEKDRMLAKFASAQSRVKIQEQLDGLSVDAEVKALDNVREHIKNTMAEANLGDELRGTDIDLRLQKLRQSAGATSANDEWERMKTERAQKATRTMG
jgi:phage shock protein A